MADLTEPKYANDAGHYPAVQVSRKVNCATSTKSANQVDNLFDVYPGDVVLNVSCNVTTAEGGTLTFDVGDGGDVDGYINGANGNSTGWSTSVLQAAAHTSNATLAAQATTGLVAGYTGGKIYTTTDTVDVKWLNAADAAIVTFRAVIIRG